MTEKTNVEVVGASGDQLFVESLRKGFLILDTLNDAGRPLKFSEISDISRLGKSGTQRFIFTLRALGFINQDPKNKTYWISPKLLQYARSYLSSSLLCERAQPLLHQLAVDTGETVNLTVLEGAEIVYIIRYPSVHSVSVDLAIGSRLPIYNTASGRAMLAYMPSQEANFLLARCELKQWTPHTKTDLDDIHQALEKIRQSGFSLSDQEAFLGDISIAAPVHNFQEDCIAAVNIAVPTPRWSTKEVLAKLKPQVIQTARQISVEMGQPN